MLNTKIARFANLFKTRDLVLRPWFVSFCIQNYVLFQTNIMELKVLEKIVGATNADRNLVPRVLSAQTTHLQPVFTLFLTLRGRSRIFFWRGCTRLLLYFNTNKPHSFFFLQNTSCIRKPQVISEGGGVRTPYTLLLDPPLTLPIPVLLFSKGKFGLVSIHLLLTLIPLIL